MGRSGGRLTPGLLTPCPVPPRPPTCGLPPSARAGPVSVARSLGPLGWRLWRPPGVGAQSPCGAGRPHGSSSSSCPSCWLGVPRAELAPDPAPPGRGRSCDPPRTLPPMPPGGNVVFPPGSLSPVRRGLSLPYKVRGCSELFRNLPVICQLPASCQSQVPRYVS